MFKQVIAPVQMWLLSKGKCVGCSMPLEKGNQKKFKNDQEMVTCKCGRMYVYDKKSKQYRRALLSEV